MRILIVEDEKEAAAVLARGLREHAFAVDTAADGPQALEQIATNDYDVVVLDVLLPGISGLEVCRRARRDGQTVPILMLTARGEPDQRVDGLDAGADDYLVFDSTIVMRSLGAAIRRGIAGDPLPEPMSMTELLVAGIC